MIHNDSEEEKFRITRKYWIHDTTFSNLPTINKYYTGHEGNMSVRFGSYSKENIFRNPNTLYTHVFCYSAKSICVVIILIYEPLKINKAYVFFEISIKIFFYREIISYIACSCLNL